MSYPLSAFRRASLILLGLTLTAAPALAGSVTADSVMDRSGARQAAMSQVPRSAIVTKTQCMDLEVGMNNIRYRCTVWYSEPPLTHAAPTPGPASQPSPGPTPAPSSPQTAPQAAPNAATPAS